jgi:hypothetical protein
MPRPAEPDIVFKLAEIPDPFLDLPGAPYLLALAELGPVDRHCVARQAAILAAALDVTVLDALELLAKIGILLNRDGH